jgi:hypothetical protein
MSAATATHSVSDGQAILDGPTYGALLMVAVVHAPSPADGLFELSRRPDASKATHVVLAGAHEIWAIGVDGVPIWATVSA